MRKIITTIILLGVSLGINAQEKIQTEIGLKNDFIYKNGKIGIGTNSPSHLLHLKSTYPYMRFEMGNNKYSMIEWNELATRYAGISWSGHKNPKRLDFLTYDGSSFSERMSILANGNVGIGTDNPSNTQGWHKVLDVAGAQHSKIIATSVNSTYRVGMFAHNSSWHGGGGFLGTESNHNLHLITDYSPKMTILTNGNIGVGTKSPSAKLDVKNGHLYVGDETFSNPGSWGQTINIDDNVHSRILIEERQTGVQTALWSHTGNNSRVGTLSNHDFGIMTKGKEKIMVKTNGNVGIGTINPDMKLTVKGKIHAEEVKIDLNVPVPDYVFKEDYKLISIEEVAEFIKENSHLPEIPSAKEFAQNGVMQAEMDMSLLKKIEELTLYTIAQEKKINELSQNTNTQQEKIKKLEEENQQLKSLSDRLAEIEVLLNSKK